MENQPTIDVRLINPFVSATIETLKVMAHTDVRRTEVLLKKDFKIMGDVSGVIGILGDDVEGTVAITFHHLLARKIISKMLAQNIEEICPDDVYDGVGEIMNMITGKAKTMLSNEGIRFNLALPTIISGNGHEVTQQPGTPCLVIQFKSIEDELFTVQIAVENK